MKTKKRIFRSLLYLAVILVVFYSVGPIIWMFLSALRPRAEFFSMPPKILPDKWTLSNFKALFLETEFISFFLNSIYISIGTIIMTNIIGILAAYSLTRFKYPGRNFIVIFSLFAYMLPPVLLVIPLYLWVVKIGLANTLASLVIAYVALTLPYSIWLLRAFFKSIPYELEEAAYIDGCNRLQTIFYVILPMAVPGIIATTVFSFTYVWNEFLFALIFITSNSKKTFPVGLDSFVTEHDIYWEYILTGSVIVAVPAVIVFLFTQKQLIQGWGAGGVKG
ncbi:MAG: carbohydrate ABC transporter permease [Firmicutes bacterium]|nr:carbohydrate ABC transporter permease [Bacillota bacterium]